MKKFTILIAGLLVAVGLFTAAPAYAADNAKDSVCEGIGLSASSGDCTGDTGSPTVNGVLWTVINVLSLLIGVAAVIMVIVGGFKYVTSGGDSNAVGSAKTTITYAIIGLLVAAFAQILIRFVLTRAATP